MEYPQQLLQVRDRLTTEPQHFAVTTPRELLGWFGHYRRTWKQVRNVNDALEALKLMTNPDFEGAGFDQIIDILLLTDSEATQVATTTTLPPDYSSNKSEAENTPVQALPADPVHRVSRLLPKQELVTVSRDESLSAAETKMLLYDYSQLPVIQGDRTVLGMISWRSIGRARFQGKSLVAVRDCMDPYFEINDDKSIFEAIYVIQTHDSVLVRNSEKKVVGILTATDISGWFEQLSRPFLLLSYIENHLRALISPKFSKDDLQSAKDPADTQRIVRDVSDLSFGEYVRLLESPINWSKLNIPIERAIFIAQLKDIRDIRNDVMHFNPEGIEEEDMIKLRRFSNFLESFVPTSLRN